MNEPPEHKSARPLARVEHGDGAASAPAVQTESAYSALAKAYMRAGKSDRFLFLTDVRAGAPNLWREVEREFVADRLREMRGTKGGIR